MSCGQSQDELWSWVQGEESPPAADQIATHVSSCAACRSEVAEMRAVLGEIRAVVACDSNGGITDAPQTIQPIQLQRAVSRSKSPQQIGPFRVFGVLGRGGMGIVYEAEQPNPLRRVALKVVNERRSSDPYRARLFQHEVAALARLNHPGIAAIHAAGQSDDGRDYYVMELVHGPELVEFMAQDPRAAIPRGLRFRLRLFVQICDAVAYAHRRGILHRDLKPANVLVATEASNQHSAAADESETHRLPQTKILDFGLARAIEADRDSPTLLSETGRIVGTLAYMSPEQSRGRPDELDVRTDVYALGVILFELLTGGRPHDIAGRTIPEAIRIICEVPPRDPRQLVRSLAPDLATITFKALSPDRDARYPTVDALREDITRYLNGYPITARPPSALDQIRKFVGRNRVTSGLAAGLAASVLVGVIVILLQARHIATERDAAILESRKTGQINAVLENMLESADPWALGRRDVRVMDVLDGAAQRIEAELVDAPLVAAAVRNTLGNTYRAFSAFAEAEAHLRYALETRRAQLGDDHRDTARSMNDLGELLVLLGRDEEAAALFENALRIRQRRLGPDDPDVGTSLNNLGLVQKRRGSLGPALASYEAALKIRRETLAAAEKQGGDRRSVVNARNQLAQTLNNLGALRRSCGELESAELLYREALTLRETALDADHPDVAKMHNNLGMLLLDRGEPGAAKKCFEQAVAILRRGVGEEHQFVAAARHNWASALLAAGDPATAAAQAEVAAGLRARLLGPAHADTLASQELLDRIRAALTRPR